MVLGLFIKTELWTTTTKNNNLSIILLKNLPHYEYTTFKGRRQVTQATKANICNLLILSIEKIGHHLKPLNHASSNGVDLFVFQPPCGGEMRHSELIGVSR